VFAPPPPGKNEKFYIIKQVFFILFDIFFSSKIICLTLKNSLLFSQFSEENSNNQKNRIRIQKKWISSTALCLKEQRFERNENMHCKHFVNETTFISQH